MNIFMKSIYEITHAGVSVIAMNGVNNVIGVTLPLPATFVGEIDSNDVFNAL